MDKEAKERSKESFLEWVTFIDDRVNKWKSSISSELAKELDWKVESLEKIENYILKEFSKDTVVKPESKETVDAVASYIGETLRLNLADAKWFIELDDERNVYFNKPTVATKVGAAISPFNLVMRILSDRTGSVLKRIYIGKSSGSQSNN